MMKREMLLQLRRRDIDHPSSEQILEWFEVLEAGWVHSGDAKKPHVLLHSGMHSDGFFMCKRVLKHPNLREILAEAMIFALVQAGWEPTGLCGVFGSPYSSIVLASEVARQLNAPSYVPEKNPSGGMIFKGDDPIPENGLVLQIEELVTTFDSAAATKEAVIKSNPYEVRFAPFVGVLINRPPKFTEALPDGRQIVALVNCQVGSWKAEECPLCKAGSRAISPKGPGWAELTA